MKIQKIHFVCYKWGSRYCSKDVNNLYYMVRRNYNNSFEFYCITDDPSGIDTNVIIKKLERDAGVGMFAKLQTFSKNFLGLEGEYVVSLDLDLVIVDNIDFVAEFPEFDFVIARDGVDKNRLHGAVYRLKVGSQPHVWSDYVADPEAAIRMNRHRTDREQQWLEAKIERPRFFPEGKIVSFKYNCGARSFRIFGPYGARFGLTTSHFGTAQLPKGAAIVSFHGEVMPKNVISSRFMEWKRAPFVKAHWRSGD